MNAIVLLFVFCSIGFANATPAIEKEFHRIVNGNECLKSCMMPVRESQLELSIFKRANYSDHLLNLNKICDIIETARVCIDQCGIKSNPFALESMKQMCAPGPREAVKSVEKCMFEVGAAVHDDCRQQCGDFEMINEDIRLRTAAMTPQETSKITEILKTTNDACGVLKCHAACSNQLFNQRCERLANGMLAGDMVRKLVEDVLIAQRADLEAHGLVEAMAQNTQPACNYLYNPQALFQNSKDLETQPKPVVFVEQKPVENESNNMLETLKRNAQQKLSLTLGQLQAQVLEKQLDVLNKQERNLDSEFEKINMDLARRMQKPQPLFYRSLF